MAVVNFLDKKREQDLKENIDEKDDSLENQIKKNKLKKEKEARKRINTTQRLANSVRRDR